MSNHTQVSRISNTGFQHYDAIDGLRAIAVLAVLVFHLNATWLPGGFTGVDIFFVISGFVVAHSMASMRFHSFRAMIYYFYARRILRIAPALIFCLLTVTLLSCMFIPKAWLSQVNSRTGLAAFFGFSNFVLAGSVNDYFSPRSDFNPFTHTWSLGVEEQFYLLFPFFLYYLIKKPKTTQPTNHVLVGSLFLFAAASLWISAWWSTHQTSYAFYMLPSRFWELACGVSLIFGWSYWNLRFTKLGVTAVTALTVIFCSMLTAGLLISNESAFPYPWALLCTLGTVGVLCIITTHPDSFISRLLSIQLLTAVGKISYSLYLWHWPVFVLFRWTVGLEQPQFKILAVVSSFLLATFSYFLIEYRIRGNSYITSVSKRTIVVGGVFITALAFLTALFLNLNQNSLSLSVTRDVNNWNPESAIHPIRLEPNCKVVITEDTSAAREGVVRQLLPTECKKARPTSRLLVAGDSHAWAYTTMLRLHAEQTGQEVLLITRGGCPFFNLRRLNNAESPFCGEFTSRALRVIAREVQAGDVLFLPSLRLTRLADQWGNSRKSEPELTADNDAVRELAISEAVRVLLPISSKGVRVVFEAPKPIFRSPAFRCSDWFNESNPGCAGGLSIQKLEIDLLRAPSLQAINKVNGQLTNASVWDPLPILCPSALCETKLKGQPLFFDGDHISGYANAYLLDGFSAFILGGSTI